MTTQGLGMALNRRTPQRLVGLGLVLTGAVVLIVQLLLATGQPRPNSFFPSDSLGSSRAKALRPPRIACTFEVMQAGRRQGFIGLGS